MKKFVGLFLIMKMLVFSLFFGCEKKDFNESAGKLVIHLTDDPFDINFIEEANVVITKVEVRSAGDTTGNPFYILAEDTFEFNLLELRNGVMAKLVEVEIPAGKYDLVRLYVEEASLRLKNGEVYKVKVPGGAQTGIKVFIKPSIVVQGGLTSDLLLDFCLDKSFVLKGNTKTPAGIKGFNFKPVIRAVNNSVAGRIAGFVSDTLNNKIVNASVWLEKDSVIAKSFTDSSGYYSIIGIPAGTYNLFGAKEGFDTLKITDIKVYSANITMRDLRLIPE